MKTNAFEVASRYVYPSLRRRLVEHLRGRGLKQTEIAKLLHITQSAVSRYLKEERGKTIDVSAFPDIDRKLETLAERIIAERPSEYEIHTELVKLSLEFLGKGYGCSFHAEIDPEIDPKKCGVCLELFGESQSNNRL
ncbi:helix-turn-helix domain-containing protein [Thermococcus sp.]|uniref:transcriptional regulator n=1 Tax=Thermococcus sp. TaxID=35749 RepID=UPI00260627AA|nr:helix-turn-helix domain-containing protein [Thermococcus sp.]